MVLRLSEQSTIMPFREIMPYKNFILNQENHVVCLKVTCILVSFLPKAFRITLSILDYGNRSCELYV